MDGRRAPHYATKPPTAYDLAIKGREHKLVWYHFKEKLPEVKPTRSKADTGPCARNPRLPRQSIVSSPKNAPKPPQTIWQKAPEINTDIKFDSPNLVAVSLPKVEPPKEFVPPVPQPKKLVYAATATPSPPELQADPARQASQSQ